MLATPDQINRSSSRGYELKPTCSQKYELRLQVEVSSYADVTAQSERDVRSELYNKKVAEYLTVLEADAFHELIRYTAVNEGVSPEVIESGMKKRLSVSGITKIRRVDLPQAILSLLAMVGFVDHES